MEIKNKKSILKRKGYVSNEVLIDKYLGKPGTPKRDEFEFELKLDVVGEIIKNSKFLL